MNLRHTYRIFLAAVLVSLLAAGRGASAQSSQQKPASQPQQQQKPASSNSNDFPTDTSTVPVMPSNGSVPAPANATSTPPPALPANESDPVRSPDDASSADSSSSYSSSSSSLSDVDRTMSEPDQPADTNTPHHAKDDKPARVPGIFNRGKSPAEAKQETSESDLDVGNYYLSTHDWKGALSRFESALVLDPENPDVYWGLAEAQRNLKDYASARANYQKLLDYDPGNKHAKEAKKLLKEPDLANAQAVKP